MSNLDIDLTPRYMPRSPHNHLTCALEVLVRVPVLASVIMGVRARAVVVRVRGGRGARG